MLIFENIYKTIKLNTPKLCIRSQIKHDLKLNQTIWTINGCHLLFNNTDQELIYHVKYIYIYYNKRLTVKLYLISAWNFKFSF